MQPQTAATTAQPTDVRALGMKLTPDLNPQPEPPGRQKPIGDFNPQPDPPGKPKPTPEFNPQPDPPGRQHQ